MTLSLLHSIQTKELICTTGMDADKKKFQKYKELLKDDKIKERTNKEERQKVQI